MEDSGKLAKESREPGRAKEEILSVWREQLLQASLQQGRHS